MEIYAVIFLATLFISALMYAADKKGWHSTAKRLTTIVRANLEAKKPLAVLEPIKESDDWEQRFKEIENPTPLVPIETPKKHAIIRHGYKQSYQGLWPEWVCKCGVRDSVPTGIWSDSATHEKARNEGAAHVRSGNLAEERLEKARGSDFAW